MARRVSAVICFAVLVGCATDSETTNLRVHARSVEVDIDGGASSSNAQVELEQIGAQLVATSARLAAVESLATGQVRLYGVLGYGTSGTCIRRFQVVQEDGSADSISYVDDLGGGASLTIEEAGVYSMSYTDQAAAVYSFGFSRNAATLNQSITAVPVSSLLTYTTVNGGGTSQATNVSATLRLSAGDVIRPHTSCDSAAADGAGAVFILSRTGK